MTITFLISILISILFILLSCILSIIRLRKQLKEKDTIIENNTEIQDKVIKGRNIVINELQDELINSRRTYAKYIENFKLSTLTQENVNYLQNELNKIKLVVQEAKQLNLELEQKNSNLHQEHQKELQEQIKLNTNNIEEFNKKLNLLYNKQKVIAFVKEAYINGKGTNRGVTDYIKEFKTNLKLI
jgi:hypothetical protein